MRPSQSTKEFWARVATATDHPLGWAVLPGTSKRATARVTVLFEESEHEVWVRYRSGGVDLELVLRADLTHFVPYAPSAR